MCVCELNACGWSLVVSERPEVEDRRPLFERLREQKERKQMEWDEQLKLSELALSVCLPNLVRRCSHVT